MRNARSTDDPGVSRHPLLGPVHRMIIDRSCSVLSFDIFDTVLWRRVPRPVDVFGILGSRLRDAGSCPSWVTDATFQRLRIDAEERARRSRGSLGTEVSLFDIWRAMPSDVFGRSVLEELVAAEVEVEREFTVVDRDIADLVALARKHDVPVVMVSDTYFTEDHLSYLLDRPELGSLQDVRIFRSSQHGTDKASGLWEIVLGDLDRSPEQVVHVGDNELADHEVPAELGMRTVHYRRLDESFQPVLERERESIEPFGPHATRLHLRHGDFGLTSLRARTLQSGTAVSTSAVDTSWRYGAAVLGPVLTGFVEWAAFSAHSRGTKLLWCPMREGELLAKLINNAARVRGWDVHAKPIWLSRHVTSLAGLDCFDTDAVHGFIRRSYQLSVRQLLAILHLRVGEVPSLAAQLNTIIDSGAIADQVSIALTETPHIKNRLAVTVTAARERLIRVLRAAGALDDRELTLVDLGWGGTIQLQLAGVLRIAQIDVTPSGLYLATDDRSMKVYNAGLRAEGYLAQAGHPREVAGPITRSPEVIEQCINALCGSLIDFGEDGSPVLGPASHGHSQKAERRAVQAGIAAFQEMWHRYVGTAERGWPDLAEPVARDRLANILVSSLRYPTAEEAAVFGNWVHEDNFGSSVVTRILPEDLVPAIPYLSPNDLDDLHMRDSFWPALIAASDTRLGAAATALSTGMVDPDVFEPSGAPFETRLRYRTPDDEWHDGPVRRVRINHNGLSFARMSIDADDVLDVSIAVPGRPAIVRVDWIEATVIAGGHRLPQPLRWENPEDFAGLTYADCRWIGANLLEFDSAHGSLWLPLAARSGAPVTSAQITIAFAMLPQSMSRLAHRMPSVPRISRISGRIREEYLTKGVTGVAAGAARVALRRLAGPR